MAMNRPLLAGNRPSVAGIAVDRLFISASSRLFIAVHGRSWLEIAVMKLFIAVSVRS